jgi:L-type amino acid transporter 9
VKPFKIFFQVPFIIPVIVLVASVVLVIAPIVASPQLEFVYSILFMVSGAIIYVPFVHYRVKLPFVGTQI